MKKAFRLKKNYQYNYVYKKGSYVSDENLVLVYCAHRGRLPKFGFSVSGKYGCAVERNRARRRLKECANKFLPFVKTGYTYIFIPKSKSNAEFSKLYRSMEKLLVSADLLTRRQGE